MFYIALKNILNHKLKSFLVAFGIIIGVGAVVTVVSVGIGGSEQINSVMSSLGLDGLIVSTSSMSLYPQNGTMTDDDISYILNTVDSVDTAMPIITQSAKFGNSVKRINGYLFGLSNNTNAVAAVTIKHGNTFTDADIKAGNYVCLIDTDMATSFFGRENVVGKTISVQVNGESFDLTVTGVIAIDSAIGSIVKTYASNVIFLPYTTICNMVGENFYSSIALSVNSNFDMEAAREQVAAQLNDYSTSETYYVQNMSSQQSQMESVINWLTGIISAVAGVSVVVGGSGIMSVMLSSVSERKKEIGIKLSVGATSKNIRAEFITEAVLISLFSGLIGLIISVVAIKIIGLIIGMNLSLKAITAIFALLFCLVIGIIFSVYPAQKAAKLNPIECLRNE